MKRSECKCRCHDPHQFVLHAFPCCIYDDAEDNALGHKNKLSILGFEWDRIEAEERAAAEAAAEQSGFKLPKNCS